MFELKIQSKLAGTRARTAQFQTPHHLLETPELAIVATEGEFKAVPHEYWNELPCKYLVVNTFHINTKRLIRDLRDAPILEHVDTKGGIHEYMNLKNRTIASDSGGFQVFSLGFGKAHHIGKIVHIVPGSKITYEDQGNPLKISEDGVSFQFDKREINLTPEISMDIQHRIGADIMFAFDECTSPLNSKEYTEKSLERTYRWLDRCIEAHRGFGEKQALFPVIQGGMFEDLRKESAEVMGSKDVPGFGIGGSFGKEEMSDVLEWTIPLLPEEKPRHLLGIGTVRDIFEAIERGVDLFDCVIPTREGRHGRLYTHQGPRALRKGKTLNEVIDPHCGCFGCREGITYAQLWELYSKRDSRFFLYATAHNIWFFSELTAKIRESIQRNSFYELKEKYLQSY
jgi:tRNA-guanine transglycosylase